MAELYGRGPQMARVEDVELGRRGSSSRASVHAA